MKPILTSILFAIAFALSSCGGGGACEGRYGAGAGKEQCFDNWDEADCTDWHDREVNGSAWTWRVGKTCEDLGFSTFCGNNTWVNGNCP